MYRLLSTITIILLILAACQPVKKTADEPASVITQAELDEWLNDAVLYEVNIRQYTPEGTFNAFAEHLPRLKELGVDILWLMPIHPISEKNRKGGLGSYYSVADYKGINPEFGTEEDFRNLVNSCHEMGFKVILDWVANHTGWDNPWIFDHPEWFTKDSTGVIIPPNADWSDIADLNFDVPEMRLAMIDAMDYWVEEYNIDGYRCDVAWGVPQDFWEAARASLDSIRPVYMLAEDEDHIGLLNYAFESNYTWKLHHITNEVAKGEKSAADIRDYFEETAGKYPVGSYPMNFITNHDENSWAGTIEQRMGEAGDAFAVFSFTIPGIPLIYSGQEAGLDKKLLFFEKDTIDWTDLAKQKFYKKLVDLKTDNQALWNGSSGGDFQLLNTTANDQVLAYKREKDSNKLMVIMNLSDSPVVCDVEFDVQEEYKSEFEEGKLITGEKVNVELQAWEYKVFSKK